VTSFATQGGDDRFYVSSGAFVNEANVDGFDFLTGHLDDVRGDLVLNAGDGRHLLMVSDEAAVAGDAAVTMTSSTNTGVSAIPGLAAGDHGTSRRVCRARRSRCDRATAGR